MSYKIKLGIPKGSLEKATIELFKKAGWRISVSGSPRSSPPYGRSRHRRSRPRAASATVSSAQPVGVATQRSVFRNPGDAS